MQLKFTYQLKKTIKVRWIQAVFLIFYLCKEQTIYSQSGINPYELQFKLLKPSKEITQGLLLG
ncbi:MAG: hypothetical protein RML72_05725, partial [Bacteroidia bacterium]|nr:hypothetical protein [Bacteroidia bacterium]MDW8158360.1 hypothetical protein [Bacteroidia bacterium]